MLPPLIISKYVIDRLSETRQKCTGNLYGTFYNKTLLVVGLCLDDINSSNEVHSFATEVDLCGVFQLNNEEKNLILIGKLFNEIDITDSPLYLHQNLGGSVTAHFFVNDKFEKVDYEIADGHEIYSKFAHIRLKTQVSLLCEVTPDAISDGISRIKKFITSGRMAFNIENTNIYILGTTNEKGYTGIVGEPTFGDILDLDQKELFLKRDISYLHDIDVIYVKMFKKATLDPYIETIEKHAPVVHVEKKLSQNLNIVLELDTLSMVFKDTKLNDLYDIMVESAIRCLRLLKKPLIKQFGENAGDHTKIYYPEIYHFYPDGCGHFISRVYDKNYNEAALQSDRTLLHKLFLLPSNQPMFRRSNRYMFKEEQSCIQIVNPHLGLKPTGYGGEIAIVRGKYRYYHYCQDNMNDDGWGCAYRSLQTLASWFLLQGYTDKPVPTYEEIQKCLVEIGDKPSSFVGSKQWIGSTEVNFVLSTLLELTSKIIYVSSGEELGMKGPELLNHFKVNGCPVMIGGGVLAHTILGVDYNHETGNLMFLILDPHYTGGEDLKIIQKKGWCGWKGVEFWDKNAYYNMCLPQVPMCI